MFFGLDFTDQQRVADERLDVLGRIGELGRVPGVERRLKHRLHLVEPGHDDHGELSRDDDAAPDEAVEPRHARQRREGRLVRFIAKAGRTVQQSGRLGPQRARRAAGQFRGALTVELEKEHALKPKPRDQGLLQAPVELGKRQAMIEKELGERLREAQPKGHLLVLHAKVEQLALPAHEQDRLLLQVLLLIFVHRGGIRGRRSGLGAGVHGLGCAVFSKDYQRVRIVVERCSPPQGPISPQAIMPSQGTWGATALRSCICSLRVLVAPKNGYVRAPHSNPRTAQGLRPWSFRARSPAMVSVPLSTCSTVRWCSMTLLPSGIAAWSTMAPVSLLKPNAPRMMRATCSLGPLAPSVVKRRSMPRAHAARWLWCTMSLSSHPVVSRQTSIAERPSISVT